MLTAEVLSQRQQDNEVETKNEPNTDFMQLGACLGTDPALMYPEDSSGVDEAKKVCRACDVQDVCLDYALTKPEPFGIWGGVSERERRRLRKQRKIAAITASKLALNS